MAIICWLSSFHQHQDGNISFYETIWHVINHRTSKLKKLLQTREMREDILAIIIHNIIVECNRRVPVSSGREFSSQLSFSILGQIHLLPAKKIRKSKMVILHQKWFRIKAITGMKKLTWHSPRNSSTTFLTFCVSLIIFSRVFSLVQTDWARFEAPVEISSTKVRTSSAFLSSWKSSGLLSNCF